MLSQVWEEKVKRNLEIPESFSKEFPGRIMVLNMGNFSWLIRSIGICLRKRK